MTLIGYLPYLEVDFTFHDSNNPAATTWGREFIGYIQKNGTTDKLRCPQGTIDSSTLTDGSSHTVRFRVTPGQSYDGFVALSDGKGGETPMVALFTNYTVPKVASGDPLGPIIGRIHFGGSYGSGTNLLFNPTGTLNLNGWNVFGAPTGSYSWYSDPYAGGRFHCYRSGTTGTSDYLLDQVFTPPAGGYVTVSGYVELDGATLGGGSGAWVDLYDQTGNAVLASSPYNTGQGATYFEFTGNVPAEHACQVRLRTQFASGDAWFYKLKAENGSTATPFDDTYGPGLLTNTHDPNGGSGLDGILDGGTYGKPLLTRLSSGKPLIDFSESIHLNKTTQYIAEASGNYYAAEHGADITGNHTANDTSHVNGLASTDYSGTFESNGAGAVRLKSTKAFDDKAPNLLPWTSDLTLNSSSSGVSPSITMTFWYDNGSGADATIHNPDGTSVNVGHTTSSSGYVTLTGVSSGQSIYALMYYTLGSGMTLQVSKTPFTISQITAAYADGGYVAINATTAPLSGISGGSSGSVQGGGAGPSRGRL